MNEVERTDAEFLTLARTRGVIGGLAIVGLWSTGPRIVEGKSVATELAFLASLIATGTLTFLLVDATRAALRARGGFGRHVAASALEGILLFGYGFVAEPFASLEGPRSLVVAAGLASLVVAHALVARRAPRLGRFVVVMAGGAGWAAHLLANPALYGSFHTAACVLVVVSGARIASWGATGSNWTFRSIAVFAACAFVVAQILLSFPRTRARFRWESPTATAFAKPILVLSDLDRDGSSCLLHAYDCAPFDASRGAFVHERVGDGIDQDCDGIDLRPSRANVGLADPRRVEGAPDVLVLSLDALRADEAHRLEHIRRELGPTYEFTSAVAPSVRTMNSFAAMMRGRTLDELPFGHASLRSTLTSDDLATVGSVFVGAGYRATFVATHSYLAPTTRVVSGFEFLRRASMPYDDPSHRDLEAMLDADDALALVLEAARSTRGPLVAWAHLMETHAPYRASRERVYGTSRADYRRAIADQDRRLAEAIHSFREIRGPSAIIVVLGDHGEAFGEHGDRAHSSSLHAEQTRVPLLIHVPGTAGRRIDAPVSTAALASTLAELAAVGNEGTFGLRSLVPCLRDDSRCPEVAISELFSLARPGDVSMRAYTTRTERTIVDRAHDVARVYDRHTDPAELRPRTMSSREAIRRIVHLDDGR